MSPHTDPGAPPRARLVVLSAAALALELALIRWLGSEVSVLAYFKNLVLVACFTGFGLGFFQAARPAALGRSLVAVGLLVAAVTLAGDHPWGPQVASLALSGFEDAINMGDTPDRASLAQLAAGLAWVLALFAGSQLALQGYAQRIGADLEAFGPRRRLEAYGLNLVGSAAGVAAFSLASWAALPPRAWFGGVWLATVCFLPPRRRLLALCGGAAVVVVLAPRLGETWSPYQRLQYLPGQGAVLTNGVGYMALRTFGVAPTWIEARGLDRWRLPHTIQPSAQDVLVVGAGGGNDVAAALTAGARRVVAVEIDPVILEIGRRHHPDRPYADPRVHVVLDDARHYAEQTDDRFDLIVFSHVDAHTALSAHTNVRLDNFVQTREAFATFRRLLRPEGAIYVAFQSLQPWVADRLGENLRLAFDGEAPVPLHSVTTQGLLAHFVASEAEGPRARARALRDEHRATLFAAPASSAEVSPSTDDWPFLYVRERRVPTPMLLLALPVAALALAGAGLAVRRDAGRVVDRHFFFLGVGFLLVEVHNVSKLARVFGTTWWVNAWVILGVLALALAGTVVAMRRPALGRGPAPYALLIGLLLVGAFLPVEHVLGLAGAAGATVFYALPLACAGLIFASSLAESAHPARALGSNVLGSVVGGFLELASFVTGLGGLLVIAAAVYLASYPGGGSAREDRAPTP